MAAGLMGVLNCCSKEGAAGVPKFPGMDLDFLMDPLVVHG